jgi:hypothetical protein
MASLSSLVHASAVPFMIRSIVVTLKHGDENLSSYKYLKGNPLSTEVDQFPIHFTKARHVCNKFVPSCWHKIKLNCPSGAKTTNDGMCK